MSLCRKVFGCMMRASDRKLYLKFHSQFLLTLAASCELYIFILCTNLFRSERILDYIFERGGNRHAGERNTFLTVTISLQCFQMGMTTAVSQANCEFWPFLTLKHQACFNSSISRPINYIYSICSLW